MRHYRALYQGFKGVHDFGPDDAVVIENIWVIVDAETEEQAKYVLKNFTPHFKKNVDSYTIPELLTELTDKEIADLAEMIQQSNGATETMIRLATKSTHQYRIYWDDAFTHPDSPGPGVYESFGEFIFVGTEEELKQQLQKMREYGNSTVAYEFIK